MERSGEFRRSLDKCGSIKSRLLNDAYLIIITEGNDKRRNFSKQTGLCSLMSN